MILKRLVEYYQRQATNNTGLTQDGFQQQEIHFIIQLDKDGRFKNLLDTRRVDGKEKSAQTYNVPREVKRTNNVVANLLWDNAGYVLGIDSKDKPDRAVKQKEAFLTRIIETFPEPRDEGINAVIKFYEQGEDAAVQKDPLFTEIKNENCNLSFSLLNENRLICERPAVKKALLAKTDSESNVIGQCLVTGDIGELVRLHNTIKGIRGAQPSGADIVSFNLPAFNSYGKEQGYNAPIGKKAEFAYTTALNSLLGKNSRQRLTLGKDTTMVFWAAQQHQVEDWLLDLLGETFNDCEAIRALYAAPREGVMPLDDDPTPFYLLGLSPNAARLAIRFWHETTVKELAKNIRRYFEDIKLIHSPKDHEYPSLLHLLKETAVKDKEENILPNLVGETMRAILAGTRYPHMLFAITLLRTHTSKSVSYHKAALIKAMLIRNHKKEVKVSLDNNNTNPGYLMGRLFAVLEHAQELANPGINATIRERFYGSAATTPGIVFPYLLRLNNHHLAKLSKDRKTQEIVLQKQIGEIIGGLTGFPAHLSLPDQGFFAVGYYHQRQDRFTKKESDAKGATDNDQNQQLQQENN